jgi:2-C-methyl-D-erythritol 4-phosphate cytidylyltransferase
VADTIRQVINGESKMLDRSNLYSVQTPQCFDAIKLKRAYELSGTTVFTDDAGVYEKSGNKVHLIAGEKSNIKITEPADLIIAEAFLKD